jgi:hypothetical protein
MVLWFLCDLCVAGSLCDAEVLIKNPRGRPDRKPTLDIVQRCLGSPQHRPLAPVGVQALVGEGDGREDEDD